ncbi:MAG: MotA/TolQ/ExbB proton channel family protein [Candidatus Hydrogenedentes bacterium]|nr:MotA/TolQ/ExbB proton channel family protein [Candidatus Hydrogenedentota bacterium]
MKSLRQAGLCLIVAVLLLTFASNGQEPAPQAAPADAPAATTPAPIQIEPAAAGTSASQDPGADVAHSASASDELTQITLWNMIKWGGAILWVIMILSVITLFLAIYLLATVTPRREVPPTFVKRAHSQLKAGDLRGAYQMCEERDEIIANVLRAGLKMHGHDRYVIQEAMESEGERGASALWQRISYLNNIGSLAPLLGLLGTVWGMIGAFGTIAMADSQARSIAMATNVSKAMITTLAGLLLAIPALFIYYYLRGRVIRIVSEVEAQATEFIELLTRSRES